MTEFLKMHGCGNDFIVIDGRKHDVSALLDNPKAIETLCDRRFGVGCDQFIVIAPSQGADAEMVIRNADGSPAGMCGNAARCVADIILKETGKQKVSISVGPRLLEGWMADEVTIDMGPPASVSEVQLFANLPKAITVDMGNPHAVFVVPDAETVALADIGPKVEMHRHFPNRTNVEFVSVEEKGQSLRMRVWERGAGITLACGSGACASMVAAVTKGVIPRRAKIRMDGGTLAMEWRESDGHVLMAGPVTYVFRGYLLG